MKNSNIEWTDHTFNPWEGCTKVSPGCANCYAATRNARFGGGTATNWGKGAPRRRTSAENWKQPVKWNREAAWNERDAEACGRDPGPRPRVFCASLADWLDDEVPIEWLADLLALIQATPYLDWLLLTKRPQNWRARMREALEVLREESAGDGETSAVQVMVAKWLAGHAPGNVWIGTTAEDQPRADERIPHLLRIPARARFLSCEPLLGPVRLGGALYSDYDKAARQDQLLVPAGGFTNAKVNWVIVGGESGPGARPMHPQWARDLRDECEEAGTHFFFKQWGEWAPGIARLSRYDAANPSAYVNEVRWVSTGRTVGITEHTKQRNLTTPEREPHRFEDGEVLTYRVGKEKAGRLLDGREWNEVPKGGAL
jgi:protein gp37